MDKILSDLNNIQDPEVRILDNYSKFNNKGLLKAPKRPLDNPSQLPDNLLDKTA